MTEVLITDVTRMRLPYICVAGLAGGRPVRLETPSPREDQFARIGLPRPGDVFDVSWRPRRGATPPHVEDGEWRLSSLRRKRRLDIGALTRVVEERALESVREAFGEPLLVGKGGNPAFPPGAGDRSLASVIAADVRVAIQYNRPRVEFKDGSDTWRNLPFEDFVVHQHLGDCGGCRSNPDSMLARDFNCGRAVLRVGLGRPFAGEPHPTACWMQVNGIYPLTSSRAHFL